MHPPHKRILWIEDDEDNREVVNFFLERSGYCVTNAGTPVEALGLAQINHFDLYLLGDWLPYGKESQLCEQIHELTPRSPILFYSAAAYQADRQRGMEAGANGYLTKPVGLDDLTRPLRAYSMTRQAKLTWRSERSHYCFVYGLVSKDSGQVALGALTHSPERERDG